MKLEYYIKEDDIGKTFNEVLLNEFNFSNRLYIKLLKNKKIYFNNTAIDTRTKIQSLGNIIIDLEFNEDNSNIISNKMDLNIIYEDEWMLVVNKPAGIPIHPSRLHFSDSLSNGIKYYYDSINLNKKIRPVNRLDIDTSGIVIFAKSEYIQEEFSNQMKNDSFKKDYLCIVNGILEDKEGIINLPISRKQGSIIERTININGKSSITNYKVIKEYDNYSLVQCNLKTGRTHQIRVHMEAISHPILGDSLYSTKSNLINRQALHSYKITCIHPVTKEKLIFIANLPQDMNILI